MTQRQEIIERLRAVDLGGGSHEMLSAICKAVLPHSDAWTLRRCADLRDRLVRLLGDAEQPKEQGEGGEYSMDELLRMLRTATSHDSCYGKMPEEWCRKHHRCVDCHSALIDAISAASCDELQRAYGYGYDAGFASADDWLADHEDAMAEHGWYRAMDADERPVRIGAAMDSDRYEDGTVVGLQFFNTANKTQRVLIAIRPHGWDTPTWHDPEDYRHHHAPTVEDVLREFADEVQRCCDTADTIAEYAAKLRLADDGKEQ